MRIYAFGGLGVDKMVFECFKINGELIVLEWLSPFSKEGFSDYLNRMAGFIDTSKPFILLGVSFGGMVAVELSKKLNPQLTIIISSAVSREEIPIIYRWLATINLVSMIPAHWLKPPSFLAHYFFGVHNSPDKKLLSQILRQTDPVFLKWAMLNIMRWKNESISNNLFRIHGRKDKILPTATTDSTQWIKGAGHFMIITHQSIISDLINEKITNMS